MSNTEQTTQVLDADVDALLEGTLDDLADIPEFKNFVVGTHKIKIAWSIKASDEDTPKDKAWVGVQLSMTAVETVELPAGSTDVPLEAGAQDNVLFMLKHPKEFVMQLGQGQFKAHMQSMAEHYGAKSNKALMEESEGAECLVVINKRKDKKGIWRTEVEKLQVI